MSKKVFFFLFFACFGLSCEVCFVAFTNLMNGTAYCNEPLWSLTGKTYVWMIPIYMIIPAAAGPLFKRIQPWPLLLRLLLYTLLILLVEFVAGYCLDKILGSCPWEYTSGWHIAGYIRLDYIPAWMFFSFGIEYLYLFIDRHLKL